MEKFLLQDLKIQLGKPYLFRHMKECDHMIIFNNIRLIIYKISIDLFYFFFLLRLWGHDLPQKKDSYPLRIFM